MKHRRQITISSAAFSLAVVTAGWLWPLPTHAFRWWECDGEPVVWDSHPDRLRASDDSFPVGNPFRSVLGEVVDRFNRNPSNFRFELVYDERVVRVGIPQSEIWFTSDPGRHGGFAAQTWTSMTCKEIRAMDIVFNVDEGWTSGTNKSPTTSYGGNANSFRTVLMHELGHAMGLYHEGDTYNVMGQGRKHVHTNCSDARAYLGEDASDGAVYLYGSHPSAGEDVGVVHWKFLQEADFEYGNYSEHTRTGIYIPGTERLNPFRTIEDGEPVYILGNGVPVDVEFTYENNGRSRQDNVQVGFYVSSNDCITTQDRRIGGFTADLGRSQVWTTARSITLPADLDVLQYYYIGAIVDETDVLEEFDETNNATYVSKIFIWF